MKNLAIIVCTLVFIACASDSGIIRTGNDTFLITKQAATGFPGTGKIKADALKEASAHCRSRKEELNIIELNENEGPFVLGKYPRVELSFECAQSGTR